MNIYWDHPHLLMGSWLKRISNAYQMQLTKVYESLDLEFEASWFPVFFILSKHGQISISELADMLEVSQPAISQMISALEKRKLIATKPNKIDARKKDLLLSTKGKVLIKQMEPVWIAIDHAISDFLKQMELGGSLTHSLKAFDFALSQNDVTSRVMDIYTTPSFEIQPLNGQLPGGLYEYFKEIDNVDFIYPEKEAVVKVAIISDEIVGAIAYEYEGDEEFVLHNLFVKPVHRLKGIAKSLISRAMGDHSKPCIHMYRATPELVDLLIKSAYTFKVEVQTN